MLKLLAVRHALGWNNVEIRQDDFHNVDARNVGRFDLAFAHGVYYHSITPFVFLENLISLSDRIYFGGYCATDDNPAGPFITLDHRGHVYRAKQYRESGVMDFYAGLHSHGYFFHADDLCGSSSKTGTACNCLKTCLSAEKYVPGDFFDFWQREKYDLRRVGVLARRLPSDRFKNGRTPNLSLYPRRSV